MAPAIRTIRPSRTRKVPLVLLCAFIASTQMETTDPNQAGAKIVFPQNGSLFACRTPASVRVEYHLTRMGISHVTRRGGDDLRLYHNGIPLESPENFSSSLAEYVRAWHQANGKTEIIHPMFVSIEFKPFALQNVSGRQHHTLSVWAGNEADIQFYVEEASAFEVNRASCLVFVQAPKSEKIPTSHLYTPEGSFNHHEPRSLQQDAALLEILAAVKTAGLAVARTFLELASGRHGAECDSSYFGHEWAGWRGVRIRDDCEDESKGIFRDRLLPNTVPPLLQDLGVPSDLGVTSIDSGGNDLSLLAAILRAGLRPAVLVVAYNPYLPPEVDLTWAGATSAFHEDSRGYGEGDGRRERGVWDCGAAGAGAEGGGGGRGREGAWCGGSGLSAVRVAEAWGYRLASAHPSRPRLYLLRAPLFPHRLRYAPSLPEALAHVRFRPAAPGPEPPAQAAAAREPRGRQEGGGGWVTSAEVLGGAVGGGGGAGAAGGRGPPRAEGAEAQAAGGDMGAAREECGEGVCGGAVRSLSGAGACAGGAGEAGAVLGVSLGGQAAAHAVLQGGGRAVLRVAVLPRAAAGMAQRVRDCPQATAALRVRFTVLGPRGTVQGEAAAVGCGEGAGEWWWRAELELWPGRHMYRVEAVEAGGGGRGAEEAVVAVEGGAFHVAGDAAGRQAAGRGAAGGAAEAEAEAEEEEEEGEGGGGWRPVVSFVVGSRRAGMHGEHLEHLRETVEGLAAGAGRHGLRAEVVAVDYSPHPEDAPLAEALSRSLRAAAEGGGREGGRAGGEVRVRVVTVPRGEHEAAEAHLAEEEEAAGCGRWQGWAGADGEGCGEWSAERCRAWAGEAERERVAWLARCAGQPRCTGPPVVACAECREAVSPWRERLAAERAGRGVAGYWEGLALNVGARRARGRWVVFMEGGDVLSEQLLRVIAEERLRRESFYRVHGGGEVHLPTRGEEAGHERVRWATEWEGAGRSECRVGEGSGQQAASTWDGGVRHFMIAPRERVLEVGGFEEAPWRGWGFEVLGLRLEAAGVRGAELRHPCGVYRLQRGGAWEATGRGEALGAGLEGEAGRLRGEARVFGAVPVDPRDFATARGGLLRRANCGLAGRRLPEREVEVPRSPRGAGAGREGGEAAAAGEGEGPWGVCFADQRRLWPHHAVFRQIVRELGGEARRVEPAWMTEISGLRVPVQLDCHNFRHRLPELFAAAGADSAQGVPSLLSHADDFPYFVTVPDRWQACLLHESRVRAGQRVAGVELPWIDEEYLEAAYVYETVLEAEGRYSVVEVGARWGTWGLRALALLRRLRPEVAGAALFFDLDPLFCQANEEMLRLNALEENGTVVCEAASAEVIASWVEERGWVDVIDLDAQGAEFELLPALIDVLDARVGRVVVGTHDGDGHRRLLELFLAHRWTLVSQFAFRGASFCTDTLRSGEATRWADQAVLLEACYSDLTPHGPVIPWDGELVLDNPRKSNRAGAHAG